MEFYTCKSKKESLSETFCCVYSYAFVMMRVVNSINAFIYREKNMKRSIKLMVAIAGFVVGVDALAGGVHIFNNSSYTLTVKPTYGNPVKVSSKKVTRGIVGEGSTEFVIESTPFNGKIIVTGKKGSHGLTYGKNGTEYTATMPSSFNGEPVLVIDVGLLSPKNKINVSAQGMNDESLQGYLRQ
jgi:hypothetical protein